MVNWLLDLLKRLHENTIYAKLGMLVSIFYVMYICNYRLSTVTLGYTLQISRYSKILASLLPDIVVEQYLSPYCFVPITSSFLLISAVVLFAFRHQ